MLWNIGDDARALTEFYRRQQLSDLVSSPEMISGTMNQQVQQARDATQANAPGPGQGVTSPGGGGLPWFGTGADASLPAATTPVFGAPAAGTIGGIARGISPGMGSIISGGIGALTSIFGNKGANNAAMRAAQLQYDAAMQAAKLQAQGQQAALDLATTNEKTRHQEWADTQKLNKQIYDAQVALEAQRYGDLNARMQPYRQFGAGSIGQLAQPIPGMGPAPGSLGARMGA